MTTVCVFKLIYQYRIKRRIIMAVLDRMKDLLTRLENNDPKLEAEILKIYSEKVKTPK